jgi:hypothetical protein
VAIKNPSSISERRESGVQERLPVVGVASIHTISTAATKDAAYRFARWVKRSPALRARLSARADLEHGSGTGHHGRSGGTLSGIGGGALSRMPRLASRRGRRSVPRASRCLPPHRCTSALQPISDLQRTERTDRLRRKPPAPAPSLRCYCHH